MADYYDIGRPGGREEIMDYKQVYEEKRYTFSKF